MPSDRDETIRVSALDEQELAAPGFDLTLSLHRRVAAKFLGDGAIHRAFSELMRGAQENPITGSYAADLVRIARRAGRELAAVAALEAAIPRAEAEHQPEIRRRLARLLSQVGRYGQARDRLREALAQAPGDVRLRHTLVAVASEEGNFELAAEELGSLASEFEQKGRHRAAARCARRLASLLDEALGDGVGAAAAWEQAARNAARGGDAAAAFSARALAAGALAGAKAAPAEIEAALRALAGAGRDAGRVEEAARLATEIGRSAGVGQACTLALLAEAAQARGARSEAGALLRAALEADPADAVLATRLESFFIGRGSWSELVAHYRERAAREADPRHRSELLGRLAEVLEDELKDPAGAAEVYGEMVELSGDPVALAAQVRLLGAGAGPRSAQQALDAAAKIAGPRARVEALVMRGEALLAGRQLERAAADFEAAVAAAPDDVRALAGLAESRGEVAIVERFAQAYARLPRGGHARAGLARRLARLLEWPLGDEARASAVWNDVLAEIPGDAEAEGRLIDLARLADDAPRVEALLRQSLARQPRGDAARAARHELARCLEEMGRSDAALEEWRLAARTDPGDAVALLAVAEGCEERGLFEEAGAALGGAAEATPAGPARAALWFRQARLVREKLGDAARARVIEERARPSTPPVSPSAREQAQAASPASADASPADLEFEITTGEILETLEEIPAAPSPRPPPVAPPPPVPVVRFAPARRGVRRPSAEFAKLVTEIEEAPLDSARYQALGEAYHRASDPVRSAQMLEIANALDDEEFIEPPTPQFTLSHGDWAALRHPGLRASATELFGLTGAALCALEALEFKQVGIKRPFSMTESRGAGVTAEALLGAVRVLGIRAPPVHVAHVAQADSAPIWAANCDPPVMLVGRGAVSRVQAGSRLRFFAGRALACVRPELMALRLLAPEQLEAAVDALRQLVGGERLQSGEARFLARRIPVKSRERIAQLLGNLEKRSISLPSVVMAARHTANRAALVAAGAVGPAVLALRAKRGAADELMELVKFAASERYFALRARR